MQLCSYQIQTYNGALSLYQKRLLGLPRAQTKKAPEPLPRLEGSGARSFENIPLIGNINN